MANVSNLSSLDRQILCIVGPSSVVWNETDLMEELVKLDIRVLEDPVEFRSYFVKRPALFTITNTHVWSKVAPKQMPKMPSSLKKKLPVDDQPKFEPSVKKEPDKIPPEKKQMPNTKQKFKNGPPIYPIKKVSNIYFFTRNRHISRSNNKIINLLSLRRSCVIRCDFDCIFFVVCLINVF